MNKRTINKCLRFLEIIDLKSSGVQGEIFYIREALNDQFSFRRPLTEYQKRKLSEGLTRYHKDRRKFMEKLKNDEKAIPKIVENKKGDTNGDNLKREIL